MVAVYNLGKVRGKTIVVKLSKEDFNMNIETANRLLQYRKKHNLSQEELANKIGVSRQAVSKWERAEASPDTDNLILLAEIYGVSLDELLKGESAESAKAEPEKEPEQEENADSEQVPTGDEGTEYVKTDKVSFKNGIHIDDKNGDKVHISFADGIHVHDKAGTKVDIDKNGRQRVYTTKDGDVMYDAEMSDNMFSRGKSRKFWNSFPFFAIALVAFLWWGFSGVCFGWALSWIVLLTIPLYYSLVDAIYKRKAEHFAYPVLVAMAYILMGYFNVLGGWTVGWVVFLSIPLYYWLCSFFKEIYNHNKNNQ